jgi:catechol 2,3-dioxygenase
VARLLPLAGDRRGIRYTCAINYLPDSTRPGPVSLTVADLERSLDFYRGSIGLDVLEQGAGEARLGAGGAELLQLVELPGAKPSTRDTGLYHLALLLPDRPSLARWLAHAARERVQLTGLSDHAVSEAIYLNDPDLHGIEIYADRPREQWEGRVMELMTTQPLDVTSLLGELDDPQHEPFDGQPAGTTMGHVHLRVADVDETIAFYRDLLGFELMAQLGPMAAFFAAGGYHHHVGANTWESRGAGPAPAGSASLRHATIVFPDTAARDEAAARVSADDDATVRDPSGNLLRLTV